MFLLVMFKMIGMLLNIVYGQVQKQYITKESNGFHNHSTLITMVLLKVILGALLILVY